MKVGGLDVVLGVFEYCLSVKYLQGKYLVMRNVPGAGQCWERFC